MRKLMTARCEDPADVFFMIPSTGDLFRPTNEFIFGKIGLGVVLG